MWTIFNPKDILTVIGALALYFLSKFLRSRQFEDKKGNEKTNAVLNSNFIGNLVLVSIIPIYLLVFLGFKDTRFYISLAIAPWIGLILHIRDITGSDFNSILYKIDFFSLSTKFEKITASISAFGIFMALFIAIARSFF